MADDHQYVSMRRMELADLVPSGATRILDVGCSRGGFCQEMLARRPEADVWGIEPNGAAAAEAAALATRVVSGSFPDDLPADAPAFDAIVFGDVLEHLADPWTALKSCHSLLSEDGVVIASIPNVRYWAVLNKLLLKADFSYTETGVLDRTHLRFFTRSGMIALFRDSGFDVVSCDRHAVSDYWKVRALTLVARRFGRDIRTMQYLLVARPL